MSAGSLGDVPEEGLGSAFSGAAAVGGDGVAADAGDAEDFDLYGDIDMDLVSSRPILAPSRAAASSALPTTSGRQPAARPAPPPAAPSQQVKGSGPSTTQAGPTATPPPAATTAASPADAGLPTSAPMRRAESGAAPPASAQVTATKSTTSSTAPKAPAAAAPTPLTSAALASEYMARHGLGPGGAPTAQAHLHRAAPQGGKEPTQVYVGELNWWTSDEEIERALAEYGRVKELRLFEEKANGKFKGYCQAEFFDADAAKACKEKMNGRVFTGRPCVVTYASTTRPRNPSEPAHGAMGMEQDMRGAGGRGRGEAGRGPSGRGGFAEAAAGSFRAPGLGRDDGHGRGGYPGGRGMDFPLGGAPGWDAGYAGGRGVHGRDGGGWERGSYAQWGGPGYGAGWEAEGPPRGPYAEGQGWYEAGPGWGWGGPNPEKRKREGD
ncbi:hydroxymethylpyrimidine kinase [Klebsormidium nitens]|uniref:Hydroxymethylpyrimidine kinase n=1 Tax=Klebsormidium nitens TaxID=105231 RepID=A0A1Y1IKF9_KLENI|nr:hydroxymethylpyrimidine kinase [Klebsormidium nitens]|eukprot:GAQ91254.1 hydroxymethylpyrimidine kinase [Klebsormidium nitens]